MRIQIKIRYILMTSESAGRERNFDFNSISHCCYICDQVCPVAISNSNSNSIRMQHFELSLQIPMFTFVSYFPFVSSCLSSVVTWALNKTKSLLSHFTSLHCIYCQTSASLLPTILVKLHLLALNITLFNIGIF